jgi:hypothetical protein
MTARIRTDSAYRGLQAITLENELLRVDLFPAAGAKIYNFVYKPADHNFMWHHPRIDLEAVPPGLSYDDHFSGGWDELFPNDAAGDFRGLQLPDHGELWCRPWDWSVVKNTDEEVVLHLRHRGAVTSTVFEKWLTLRAGEPKLRFRHRLTNTGKGPLDFLWKLHPALAVTEHCRVDVPGRRGEYVAPGWSRLDDAEAVFDWPIARNAKGGTADLRHVLPATSGKRDFVYVTELREGWCALTDTSHKIGFGLAFPREVFPSVWLFMPAGGWRDLQMVILEPCTAWPKDLDIAAARGTIAHLDPGGVLECEVTCVVYTGMTGVGRIAPDGVVTAAGDEDR